MKNLAIKNRLIELKNQFPALTFDNNGYEYISPDVRELHAEQISEIGELIKQLDSSFVKFFNFKPRKDGSFAVRYDCYYDQSTIYFIGVHYLVINDIV